MLLPTTEALTPACFIAHLLQHCFQIPIICNTIKGTFLLADMRVVCSCTACAVQPVERRTFTPTQYEQHAGCGSAKKWKASIRIEAGAVAECPKGSAPLPFGKWLEVKGIEAKGSKSSGGQGAKGMEGQAVSAVFTPHTSDAAWSYLRFCRCWQCCMRETLGLCGRAQGLGSMVQGSLAGWREVDAVPSPCGWAFSCSALLHIHGCLQLY